MHWVCLPFMRQCFYETVLFYKLYIYISALMGFALMKSLNLVVWILTIAVCTMTFLDMTSFIFRFFILNFLFFSLVLTWFCEFLLAMLFFLKKYIFHVSHIEINLLILFWKREIKYFFINLWVILCFVHM